MNLQSFGVFVVGVVPGEAVSVRKRGGEERDRERKTRTVRGGREIEREGKRNREREKERE